MEHRFKRVRKQLDDLGYMQVLIPEALPLVEKLAADLIQTTESLQKYKKIAKNALEEQDNLQLGAEPYKCDNAKLVRECNDLHLAFIQFREQNEKTQKDLKRRLSTLEKEKLDCEAECEKLRKRGRDLEFESARKTDRILAFQNKNLQTGGKTTGKSSLTAVSKSRTSTASKSNTEISTTMALADQKIASLSKEIQNLKDERLQLSEMTETYKNQLNNRDREIQRLNQMLEGGRPIQALNQDCCSKDVEAKLYRMEKEVRSLEKDKFDLETRLKESVAKQHEAMKRALYLADRNKQLEKELRDIDQMALAVEADCNSTVQMNAEKIITLQDKVHDAVLQIQSLEREVTELKRDKQELLSDLDALKLEKKHLQTVLETALDEKKRLNDRINQFTVIEHDLNLEIDRLVQASANQKRKIAELECKLVAGKFDAVTDRSGLDLQNNSPNSSPTRLSKTLSPMRELQNKCCQKSNNIIAESNKPNKALPSSLPKKTNKTSKKKAAKPKTTKSKQPRQSVPKNPSNSPNLSDLSTIYVAPNTGNYPYDNDEAARKNVACSCCSRCFNDSNNKPENNKLENNMPENNKPEYNKPESNKPEYNKPEYNKPENNKTEVDNTCCQCCPCMQSASASERVKTERDYYMKEYHRLMEQMKNIPSKPDNHSDLLRKLHDSQQSIASLQHENKTLAQEKHNLMTRLETTRDRAEGDYDGFSLKSSVRRLERERDILKGDITRLEEERDAVRQHVQSLTEKQGTENARIEKALIESEDEVRRLEQERRELIQCQGSRRATISSLEDQCDTLKNQLQVCQTELNHQRSLYTQLKTLHEQTDKALGDSQGQLTQVETETANYQDHIESLEKKLSLHDQEVAALKNDIMVMKGNLAQMDKEKDALLIAVDDKTEKLALMEQELRAKDDKLRSLDNTVGDLKKKLSVTADSSSARDKLLRNASAESASLRQELEIVTRAKDGAIHENRLLQDDLAACAADCRCARNELDGGKRQIEDLKLQLQHYVAEVKRFEDLMTQKEGERSDLLDQFRSLSQEAELLENNNHTLTSEATQSKVQLSVTLDHVSDLETKLTSQDGMISGYEKKIAELTSKIANLEGQLCHCQQQQERTEADLGSVRDLCMKLDKQKDNLTRELGEKDEQRSLIDRDMLRLRRESETLQNTLTKDRMSAENLERLLADARQEGVQLQLRNQELDAEIQALKAKIEDLQSRLSPTTATFTYSAKIGTPCTFCGSCTAGSVGAQNDKGDVVETTSAVISRMSPKNDSRPESLKSKGKAETTEPKVPEWKTHQNRDLPSKLAEGKNVTPHTENLQQQPRSGFSHSLSVEGDKKETDSVNGNIYSRQTYSIGVDCPYKAPTIRAPSYSYSGSTTSEKQLPSYINPSFKSTSITDSQFLLSNSIKADSIPTNSNKNYIKHDQQTCPNCNGSESKFRSNYKTSLGCNNTPKTNETDNVHKGCNPTTCPAQSRYTSHYSAAKNN